MLSDAKTVDDLVITRFLNLFGAPNVDDVSGYYGEYERALIGITPELLEKACDRAVNAQTYKVWPTIGSIRDHVSKIQEERAAAAARRLQPAEPDVYQKPDPESVARVEAMMRECVAKLRTMGPPPPKQVPLPDVSRPAWEKRLRESPMARWLSLPQEIRDDILGIKPR